MFLSSFSRLKSCGRASSGCLLVVCFWWAAQALAVEHTQGFWAFQTPRRHPVPAVSDADWPRTDVDRFILRKLEEAGLAPTRDADRYTLLRRVTYDLTGLPPTPEAIQTFVNDASPDAFEKVADRLLASPGFGERWGRHWLDLACYADLAGGGGNVIIRDAWRYRDYVLGAFNTDKPYNQFVREQVAGDLLTAESDVERRDQIVATGFLAIGPWSLENYIKGQMLADVVDHQIDKVGRVVLGISLSCARCHDHKSDPVPITDYYALAGIFHSTVTTRQTGPGVWSNIIKTPLPEFPAELEARRLATAECEASIAAVEAERKELNEKKEAIITEVAAIEAPTASAEDSSAKERTRLAQETQEIDKRLSELKKRKVLLDYNRPRPPEALALRDVESPTDSRIYVGGNFTSLGDVVPRSILTALVPGRRPVISPEASGRKELAAWLSERDHPLTARVLVNRVWHHIFGRGLVRSVDYFGAHGERPSHAELLDHLAVGFVEEGWSIKRLIRKLVLSRVYQMASDHNEHAFAADPGGRWRWRMERRRLEAEAIRDSIFFFSGQLDRTIGGPTLGLDIPGLVLGIGGDVNPPKYGTRTVPEPFFNRRVVYLPLRRERPGGDLEILDVFDFPHPDDITGARSRTNVPTQALFLMNSPLLKEHSRLAAERLLSQEGLDDTARIERLALLAFSRPATAADLAQALNFLEEAEQAWAALPSPPKDPHLAAWTEYCHAVLASGDFLFRE